jgi:uncharacterized protein YrrD
MIKEIIKMEVILTNDNIIEVAKILNDKFYGKLAIYRHNKRKISKITLSTSTYLHDNMRQDGYIEIGVDKIVYPDITDNGWRIFIRTGQYINISDDSFIVHDNDINFKVSITEEDDKNEC